MIIDNQYQKLTSSRMSESNSSLSSTVFNFFVSGGMEFDTYVHQLLMALCKHCCYPLSQDGIDSGMNIRQ